MSAKRVVLIDNYDSFTYNLVDFFRRAGADVTVVRNTENVEDVATLKPELVVYSPGPGTPAESGNLLEYIQYFTGKVPQFGVCLGMQAMAESFGGSLRVLDAPMHGKASEIEHDGNTVFNGLPGTFFVGRYHSLVVDELPDDFVVSARTTDESEEVMAIRHKSLPIEGVQFHPESILSTEHNAGVEIVEHVLQNA